MSDYIYVSDTDRLKAKDNRIEELEANAVIVEDNYKAMVAELESYLDEEREKNEKQVRMTMDLQARVEELLMTKEDV